MALQVNQIQKPVGKLRKLLKKMPDTPSPKEVHDFRTRARRVESTLRAFSLDSGHNGRRTSKALSRLRKRAGKIRDLDVLMDDASKLRHDDDEQACLVQLLEHVGAQRLKQARKFHAVAQRWATKLNKGLKRISAKIEEALPAKTATRSPRNTPSSDAAAAD